MFRRRGDRAARRDTDAEQKARTAAISRDSIREDASKGGVRCDSFNPPLCSTLTLGSFARTHSCVEIGGLPARYAQRRPALARQMLRDVDNLANVIRIVRHLAIDRLHHGMAFAANAYRAAEVGVGKRLQRVEKGFPASRPHGNNFGSRQRWIFELRVAIAIGLLSVRA